MAGRLSMATERLASAMRPLPTSSFGYPVREPVPSEQAFFALNPNVGGYAAEDGAVVLNEGARSGDRYLSNRELGGVARNEASRLYMRDRAIVPDFSLTKDQELKFQGTAYGSNPEALKQSIAARIITGDQSAGETTKEQQSFAQSLLKQMRANGEPVATNPEPKRGIMARVANKLEQVLGVPRPWELGLAPSVGYQLATGEGSLGERVRKGGAQFLGRYATNMVDPAMELNFPRLNEISPRAIIKDQAPWLTKAGSDTIGNEVFAREMFDLPPRFPMEQAERAGFVKTGPKQYTLQGQRAPEGVGEGLHYNSLLGRYNVTENPETQKLEYKDVWDISSPVGGSPVINMGYLGMTKAGDYGQEGSLLSHMIRETVNPYLRPVTVSGPTAP